MKIQINHIGKMEGHADFVAEIIKGDVKSAKIMTTEGARLIEGILIGRHFSEAPIITSRICGICPVVHKLSSIKAIENAFLIKSSIQTEKLRRLLLMAQTIHSHALHLFFLSMPDFFDLEDDFKFMELKKKETNCAIKVRQWALKIIQVVGGRAVHPIACEVGGFKALPDKNELKVLSEGFEEALKNAICLVNLVTKIRYPKFERETRFVSLFEENGYAFYQGDLKFSGNSNQTHKIVKNQDFAKNIKEIEDPYRAAKSAELDGQAFMVGALARINNNKGHLNKIAKGIFKGLDWKLPDYNTFHNIIAQAVEIVHCLEEAAVLIDELKDSLEPEVSWSKQAEIIAGSNPLGREVTGADAVEAPRGTLYHHYKIDKNGYIVDCQIITPTVSFLKNLEEDIVAYLPEVMKMDPKKRSLKIRSLIRAYDPCISCATH